MLRYFPPFPSPNPASVHTSPLETSPIVPSPPSSNDSFTPSPASSNPQTSSSRSSSTHGDPPLQRSRSRSAARKCVPSHTRIIKQHNNGATAPLPSTPPLTPPSLSQSPTPLSPMGDMTEKIDEHSASENESFGQPRRPRKGSLRKHHYEDAVRIACGAWGESATVKKKTVTFEKKVVA